MRKVLTLMLMMAAAVGAITFFGGMPVDLPVDSFLSRGGQEHPGEELNAKGVDTLADSNPEMAVTIFREALELEPGDRIINRNLSVALARVAAGTDQDEEAMVLLGESEELWPVNPEALDGLSTLHFRAGRYQEALEYALKLQKRIPDREDLNEYVAHLEQKVAGREGMVIEQGDNFRLLYSGQRKLEYEGEILALLQTQMDSLTVALGIFPSKAVDVLVLTEDLGSWADPLDPSMEGLYDGQIRLFVGEGIDDEKRLTVTVRHEMVHALLHGAAGDLPSWVQEGVAQKIGENPDGEHLQAVRSYIAREMENGFVVDLSSLDRSFITMDPEHRTRAYAVSFLLMDHLERSFGNNFIQLFVSELVEGTDPQTALKTLTGRTLGQLQDSLTRELGG